MHYHKKNSYQNNSLDFSFRWPYQSVKKPQPERDFSGIYSSSLNIRYIQIYCHDFEIVLVFDMLEIHVVVFCFFFHPKNNNKKNIQKTKQTKKQESGNVGVSVGKKKKMKKNSPIPHTVVPQLLNSRLL